MASRHGAIIDALEALIAATVSGETIYQRPLPIDRDITLGTGTHIILSPAPEAERYAEGTSGQQAWWYPVTVAIVKASNQSLDIDDGILEVRQQIRQRLNRRSLTTGTPAITGCPRMEVEPGPVFSAELWGTNNVLVSVLTVNVLSYEVDT